MRVRSIKCSNCEGSIYEGETYFIVPMTSNDANNVYCEECFRKHLEDLYEFNLEGLADDLGYEHRVFVDPMERR